MRRYPCSCGLALLIFFAAADAGHALPLTPSECDQVRAEQLGLESSGVTADMAQGAEWARSNLSPDRLQRIARWIELQEKVLFRCPRPKPPPEPATAAADGGPQEGAAQKRKKPRREDEATPQPAAAASETGDGAREAPAVKPKPKPQKKPKADDAYRPPAPFSGDELQHMTPGTSAPPPGGTVLTP